MSALVQYLLSYPGYLDPHIPCRSFSAIFRVFRPTSVEESNDDYGGRAAARVLHQALGDADYQIRDSAVLAPRDIGGDQAALVLADALQDEAISLRLQAVDALVEIGSETAVDLLQRALQNEEEFVRGAAAAIIKKM